MEPETDPYPIESADDVIRYAIKLLTLREIPVKQRTSQNNKEISELTQLFAENGYEMFKGLTERELVFISFGEDDPVDSPSIRWEKLLAQKETQVVNVSYSLMSSRGNEAFVMNTEAYTTVLGGLEEIQPLVSAYDSIVKRLTSVAAAICPVENQWQTQSVLALILDPKIVLAYERLKMTQERLELRAKALERAILTISRQLGLEQTAQDLMKAPIKKDKPWGAKPENA